MARTMTPAMMELRAALNEAEALTAKGEMTKRDEARLNVMLAKIAALKAGAVAPDDFCKRWFRALIAGAEPEQRATALAGTQTVTYTQGAAGGYLVPQEVHDAVFLGLAQVDPLLDPDVVTLVESGDGSLRPYNLPGWDLSTFAAVKVNEANQHSFGDTVPAVTNNILNGYTYRATLAASLELETDAASFQSIIDLFAKAYAIGFARGIGADLAAGNGTSAPQGITVGAANSNVTTAVAGVIGATDIENIYFAVNRIYRNAEKCAWVMNDTQYQHVRKAVDLNGRPLLNVIGDRELLMGKPVYVSPTVNNIIFGDLSYYVVRCSEISVRRTTDIPGGAEYGIAAYVGLMRADAKVITPAASSPAIVYATLHS